MQKLSTGKFHGDPSNQERPAADGGSLRLDARELDYLGPFLGFVGDELAEVGGRTANTVAPRSANRAFNLGIGEDGIDLPVELVDDLGWRVRGHADAVPSARLIARQKFVDGRDVRQRCRARRSRHR